AGVAGTAFAPGTFGGGFTPGPEGGGATPEAGTFAGVIPTMGPMNLETAVPLANRLVAPASTATSDSVPAVRRAAVTLLGGIAQVAPAPALVQPLIPALKDTDADVRRLAAGALNCLVSTRL